MDQPLPWIIKQLPEQVNESQELRFGRMVFRLLGELLDDALRSNAWWRRAAA